MTQGRGLGRLPNIKRGAMGRDNGDETLTSGYLAASHCVRFEQRARARLRRRACRGGLRTRTQRPDPGTLTATAKEIRDASASRCMKSRAISTIQRPGRLSSMRRRSRHSGQQQWRPAFKTLGAITREDILAGVESNMLTQSRSCRRSCRHGSAQVWQNRQHHSGSVRAPIAGLDVSSGARAA